VTTYAFLSDRPDRFAAGVLAHPVFEGPELGPGLSSAGLLEAYKAARLSGKRNENLLLPSRPGDRLKAGGVLLVGAGPRSELTPDLARRVLGRAAGTLRRFRVAATTFPHAFNTSGAAAAVMASVEGIGLGAYRFDRLKSVKEESALRRIVALGPSRWDSRSMSAAARRAGETVEAVTWARDLVNTPAGLMPPAKIAQEARAMARSVGLRCKVWTQTELKRGGFGGILGVGQGSVNAPRMIELTYSGAGRAKPIALTGKGISFDSGGLSIKDSKGMEWMKADMGGAASILGAMRIIAKLKPRVNVIAAIPCAENMPSGSAQKPGDVIVHRGGKTSEVLNTDAEGRLVLADALAYLSEKKPSAIVDTATLTGACMVALGNEIAGALGNDDDLISDVIRAGEAVGEPIWQLPLFQSYRRLIDSNVADIKNIGERWGGAITAAWFLAEFVGDTPWVHLDIAGPAFSEKVTDLAPKGATGFPVRALVQFVLDRAER
jgi:leucyl aminopeptidase